MSLGLLSAFVGCSNSPAALKVPDWDRGAGEAAIKEYDASGDGALDDAELEKVPALKSAISRVDANRDGKVDAGEINNRIQAWRNAEVAIMPITVNILRDRRPLPDAEVTIVPEKFLGTEVKPAKGTTNRNGTAVMRISAARDEQGVQQGFYRIHISKKAGDNETIPAKYNAKSELGTEVAADTPALQDVILSLSSR